VGVVPRRDVGEPMGGGGAAFSGRSDGGSGGRVGGAQSSGPAFSNAPADSGLGLLSQGFSVPTRGGGPRVSLGTRGGPTGGGGGGGAGGLPGPCILLPPSNKPGNQGGPWARSGRSFRRAGGKPPHPAFPGGASFLCEKNAVLTGGLPLSQRSGLGHWLGGPRPGKNRTHNAPGGVDPRGGGGGGGGAAAAGLFRGWPRDPSLGGGELKIFPRAFFFNCTGAWFLSALPRQTPRWGGRRAGHIATRRFWFTGPFGPPVVALANRSQLKPG